MRNVLKATLFLALFSALGFAQGCDATHSCISLYFYSGGNVAYICAAPVVVAPVTVNVADATLTNIVVSSNVGTVTTSNVHGLWVGAMVTVSGSPTSALNGTYPVASVPSTTTFTIATAGVSDATYTSGLVVSTNSPTTGSPVWRITVFKYIANVLDSTFMGGGSSSYNYRSKCTDRGLY